MAWRDYVHCVESFLVRLVDGDMVYHHARLPIAGAVDDRHEQRTFGKMRFYLFVDGVVA